ncbi:SoxR reducing system RseC family protein [Candidatus Poribacteria bacterium]|nr:SoxR reducing system RseC family protein [Candidatus Poribacteria bacterium]
MTERGLVIDISEQIARVKVEKSGDCGSCNACSIDKNRTMIAEVDNPINAKKGDSVLIEVSDNQAIKAGLLVFGLPLAALFLGVFGVSKIAESIGFTNSSNTIGGIIGFMLFALVSVGVYFYSGHSKKNGHHSLKIIKILKT